MRLFVAGDFCPSHRAEEAFNKELFDSVFNDVLKLIHQSDYSIVNLECPIVTHEAKPIEKCGPNLKTDFSCVKALQYAGFKCVTLANNHFYDYGEQGVIDTIENLKGSLDIVGGGRNLEEASKTLYKEIGGSSIAIVNYCEKEFSIASNTKGGSHTSTPIRICKLIKEAQKQADYVVVIVHGGNEHYQLPSPRLKETYRFYIDQGADVVINHHQHCICGYEEYNGRPIFYGLGNFCFDKPNTCNQKWNQGIALTLELKQNRISYSIHPYEQCNEDAGIHFLEGKMLSTIMTGIEHLNSIIADDQRLAIEYKKFMDGSRRTYNAYFEPYNNRILQALYRKGYIPSFLTKRKRLILQNFLICESHHERVLNSLFQ